MAPTIPGTTALHEADSPYAWRRLAVALALMTLGSSGMYVVSVVLPTVQAEFGVGRSEASLPYTLLMIGFGAGGILMGRLADRFGVTVPLMIGAVGLGGGFIAAGMAGSITAFALINGVAIGLFGCSATFAPLVADTSLWFVRRRGIAVAICASGNYLAGAVWPPIVQHAVQTIGWRQAYMGTRRALRGGAAAAGAADAPAPAAGGGRAAAARLLGTGRPVDAALRPVDGAGAGAAVRGRRGLLRWRCRCRRCTSSPTAAISATARRAARRCCR